MTAPLAFKDPRRHLIEWGGLEPVLAEITFWLLDHAWPTAMPAMVTSIWRTFGENAAAGARTDVHCQSPHRAIDLSLRGLSGTDVDRIVKMTNAEWLYDPLRLTLKVAYIHNAGSGEHLHLQCHSNTKRLT